MSAIIIRKRTTSQIFIEKGRHREPIALNTCVT